MAVTAVSPSLAAPLPMLPELPAALPELGVSTPRLPDLGAPTSRLPDLGAPTPRLPDLGTPTSRSPDLGATTPRSTDLGVTTPRSPDLGASSSRSPDTVVFSSAPFRLLAEVATTGLRQLATLLPTLERVAADPAVAPSLGHLAKAAAAAARQVSDGHDALLAQGSERIVAALPGRATPRAPGSAPPPGVAEPPLRTLARSVGQSDAPPPALIRVDEGFRATMRQLGASADAPPLPFRDIPPDADPATSWLREADHLLRRADDALDSAINRPPLPPLDPLPLNPAAINWALVEVAAARSDIVAARTRLAAHPAAARSAPSPGRATFAHVALPLQGGLGLLGLGLLFVLLLVVTGAWSLAAGLAALAGTALCAWRIGRASIGVRLDGRA